MSEDKPSNVFRLIPGGGESAAVSAEMSKLLREWADAFQAIGNSLHLPGRYCIDFGHETIKLQAASMASSLQTAMVRVANTERVEREHRHAMEDAQARIAALEAKPPLRVVAAAVMAGEVVFSLPSPKRHHHILHSRAYQAFRGARNRDGGPDGLQGFLLSDGTFADRMHAWEVAAAAGQLLERAPTDKRGGALYSEDIFL